MKKLIITLVLISALLLVGCRTALEESMEQQIEADSELENVDIETSGSNVDPDEWCQAGAEWKFAGTTEEGDSSAKWTIEEKVSGRKYDGLCHVVYEGTGPTGQARMDYYFDEDGENGFIEWEINGQTFSSEWHK